MIAHRGYCYVLSPVWKTFAGSLQFLSQLRCARQQSCVCRIPVEHHVSPPGTTHDRWCLRRFRSPLPMGSDSHTHFHRAAWCPDLSGDRDCLPRVMAPDSRRGSAGNAAAGGAPASDSSAATVQPSVILSFVRCLRKTGAGKPGDSTCARGLSHPATALDHSRHL